MEGASLDDSYRYTYDALDRLIRAENASVRYDYAYDPFNRRLSTTTFTSTQDGREQVSCERYLWQKDCEVGSVDGEGNVASLRVLGEGLGAELGAAVLFELNGTVYIPLHDLSGNVRVLLTSDGQEAERLPIRPTSWQAALPTSRPGRFLRSGRMLRGLCTLGSGTMTLRRPHG